MSTNLKQKAYRFIQKGLMESQWGQEGIFSPAEVAKSIGMSYTPVREAIIQLESEGLLEKVSNRGVRPKVLGRNEFEKMFEFRILMESGAAKIAAQRITPDELQKLRRNCRRHLQLLKEIKKLYRNRSFTLENDKIVDLPFLGDLHKLNFEFHLTIITATQNPQLIKTVGDLHILTNVLRKRVYLADEDPIKQLTGDFTYHYKTYKALQTGQGSRASEAMEKHLSNALAHHLRLFDSLNQVRKPQIARQADFSENLMNDLRNMEEHLPH